MSTPWYVIPSVSQNQGSTYQESTGSVNSTWGTERACPFQPTKGYECKTVNGSVSDP